METSAIIHSGIGARAEHDRKQRYYDTEDSTCGRSLSSSSYGSDEDDEGSVSSEAALPQNTIPPGLLAQFDRSGLSRSERKTTIMSIKRLSSHVPECVRHRIEQEIELKGKPETSMIRRLQKPESSEGDSDVSDSSYETYLKAADFLGAEHDQQRANFSEFCGIDDIQTESGAKQKNKRNSISSFDTGKIFQMSTIHGVPRQSRRMSLPSVNGGSPMLASLKKGRRRSDSFEQRNSINDVSCRYFDENRRKLPFAEKYLSALLLVDISGFTKLATLLGPEQLSKVS